jgi:O-glycosyl hydrolase
LRDRNKEGATFIAGIWNVPKWMRQETDALRYHLKPGIYPELAESIVSWVLWAKMEHGITIDYISLNEPDLGCYILMPPDKVAPLIVETGKLLQQYGLQTRWLLGEVSVLRNCQAYAETVWSYPKVRPYMGPLTCHSYDQRWVSDAALRDLASFAQETGREFWVTEAAWRGGLGLHPELYPTWENAIELTAAYSRLLKEGQATTMIYWQMLRDGWSTNDGVRPYPALDMLAQYKREIPAGSQIIETSPNTKPFFSLAVKAPAHFALFVINKNTARQNVQIVDLPPGTYYHVTSNQDGTLQHTQEIAVQGDPIIVSLTAQSVNVLTTQPPAQ